MTYVIFGSEGQTEMSARKKLNYYLMKANRVIVWGLLFFMILFIVTGYALTKPSLVRSLTGGIVDYPAAFYLHTTLDIPLFVLLLIHVVIEIKFSLMRWGFKNKKLLNSLMLVLGLTLLILIFYVDRASP